MKDELKKYISPSIWTDIYYEIIDFYYWEPQHIGKTRLNNTKFKNVESVINHISNLEVSLNHILNIYFSMLPSEMLLTIFQSISKKVVPDDYQLMSIDTEWLLKNETQPDFVFMGKRNICYIEMKTKSKSSQKQYEKYLKLHSRIEQVTKKNFGFSIIFLSKYSISEIFEEKYGNLKSLQLHFTATSDKNLVRINSNAIILHFNYKRLLKIINSIEVKFPNPILTKINSSIEAELKYRNLV